MAGRSRPDDPGGGAPGGRARRRWLPRLAVGAVVLIGLSVAVVKRADQENRFCIACHLHQQIYDRMVAAPPVTLAGVHAHAAATADPERDRARLARHPERCFTCHSGEGVVGWSAVTLLSAWDAARWVAGDRHEPTSMRLPIGNDACVKCHAEVVRGTRSGEETEKYHELLQHRDVKTACVACHQTHRPGDPKKQFLDDAVVRARCQSCHRNMDEG